MLKVSHLVWSLKTAWRVNSTLTAIYFISAILRGFVPIVLVVATRFLINDIVSLLNDNGQQTDTIFIWLALLGFVTLVDLIALLVGSRYVPKRLEDELHTTIASEVMEHAYKLPLHLFENHEFQDTLERAQQNLAINFIAFFRAIVESLTGILQVLSLFVVLVVIEPLMVVIAIVAMPTYGIIIQSISQQRYHNEYKRAPDRRWTRYFTELMLTRDYATEVRMLGIGNLIIERFQHIMNQIKRENALVEHRALIASTVFAVITIGLFYAIFYLVIVRVISGTLTPGDIAILGGAIARLTTSAENIVATLGLALERSLHVSNLQTYLAIPTQEEAGHVDTSINSLGQIRFQNVSFTYPDTTNEVLSDCSFTINQGETVAIVGENGAGKSTIVKLLARIYEPDSGTIFIDSIPLDTIPQHIIFQYISFMLQNFGKYEATVSDNIAYGNPPHYLGNLDKIRSLAQQLDIHTMISALPDGYNTFLGRQFGEYDLSGGQWQQLAIARAFARASSVLVLDEPTSNFDARTEHAIFSRFVQLSHHRTSLLISHRFTTVSMADRILVLAAGHISEQGTHDELIQTHDSLYAQLYKLHSENLR